MTNRETALRRPTARRFDLAIVSALLGGALAIYGAFSGIAPMLQRRAPCFYAITPPAEFDKYYEGVSATGPQLSLLPFGAQCAYVVNANGESAMSEIPLWPSFMIFGGFALFVLGVTIAIFSYRRSG
jgi:hypothetical protein